MQISFFHKENILGFFDRQVKKCAIAFKKYEMPLFVALFVFLACHVVLMYFMHEPWTDEAHPWLVVRDNTFLGVLAQLKHDGHTFVWYLLIFPLAQLGLPFDSMRILHGIIVIACFFVICFCMKCHPLLRLALALGTTLPAEISLFSRVYAPAILLILLLAIWHDRRFTSRKLPYALCLLFLANTNVYAAVVPIAFLCGEVFLAAYAKFIEQQTPYAREEWSGVVIVYSGAIVGIFLLLVTLGTDVFQPFSSVVVKSPVTAIDYRLSISPYDTLPQFLQLFRQVTFRGSSYFLFRNGSIFFFTIWLFCLCGAMVFLSLGAKRRWLAGVLLVLGTMGYCAVLFLAKGNASARHAAVLPFYFMFIWYVTGNGNTQQSIVKQFLAILVICVIVQGTTMNYNNVKYAIQSIASPQQRIAFFIKNNGYDSDDVLIIGEKSAYNPVALAYLQNVRTFRYLYGGKARDLSYVVWQDPDITAAWLSEMQPSQFAKFPGRNTFHDDFQRLPLKKRDTVTFAEQQAELHKDTYRAILLLKFEDAIYIDGDYSVKLNHKLIYRERRDVHNRVWHQIECADLYLLAENGQLVPDDGASATEEGIGTHNMPNIDDKLRLAKFVLLCMVVAAMCAGVCAAVFTARPPKSRHA